MQYFRNSNTGEKGQDTTQAVNNDQSRIIRLVERAASGDIEAFGNLYTIYVEQIYRYVFYQVKDKMTAEDITEEVFIKAWRAIDSCKGRGETFSSWLYRIAHNCTIDVLRSRQKRLARETEVTADVSYSKQEAEVRLKRQELLEAVARLPQNQKQVIILKFIEGLDNQEIGQVMNKNQGAIRVLQMRALATLRQRLGGEA
jgi:RNA polymerase sigma-70 factor (ECF subfamily)